MPNVQIKNVPEDAHAILRARAAQERLSLQEYTLRLLVTHASQPTLAEVLDRAAERANAQVSAERIQEILDEERARR